MTNAPLVIVAALASSLVSGPIVASQMPPVVKACGLLPKAEVKKLIGATDGFDSVEPKEEPTTNGSGSSCKYASVFIQVGRNTFNESSKSKLAGVPGMEPVPGLGEQAYLYNNPAGAVEVFVKVGPHALSVSRPVGTAENFATVRPGVLALAKALVAKLQ